VIVAAAAVLVLAELATTLLTTLLARRPLAVPVTSSINAAEPVVLFVIPALAMDLNVALLVLHAPVSSGGEPLLLFGAWNGSEVTDSVQSLSVELPLPIDFVAKII